MMWPRCNQGEYISIYSGEGGDPLQVKEWTLSDGQYEVWMLTLHTLDICLIPPVRLCWLPEEEPKEMIQIFWWLLWKGYR